MLCGELELGLAQESESDAVQPHTKKVTISSFADQTCDQEVTELTADLGACDLFLRSVELCEHGKTRKMVGRGRWDAWWSESFECACEAQHQVRSSFSGCKSFKIQFKKRPMFRSEKSSNTVACCSKTTRRISVCV